MFLCYSCQSIVLLNFSGVLSYSSKYVLTSLKTIASSSVMVGKSFSSCILLYVIISLRSVLALPVS